MTTIYPNDPQIAVSGPGFGYRTKSETISSSVPYTWIQPVAIRSTTPIHRFLPSNADEPWVEKALEKLASISELKPGWNGYAAPPPSAYALRLTERFIFRLYEDGLEPQRLAASVVGGVGVTFRKGSRSAYLEIYNNGDSYLLLSDDDIGETDVTPERLGAGVVRRIREYVHK